MLDQLLGLVKNIAPTLFGALTGGTGGAVVSVVSWLGQTLLGDGKASIADIVKEIQQKKIDIAKLDHDFKMAQLNADIALVRGQMELNKIEANGTSLFRAGWRPAVGWVCVIALFSNYIISPYLSIFGYTLPQLSDTLITGILLPMLGLGAMRTFEKISKK